MLAFVRNSIVAILGIALFVWLLTVGAVVALIFLLVGGCVYGYLQLVRRGVLNPPAHWAQYRQRQAEEETVIEADYTVIESDEQEN